MALAARDEDEGLDVEPPPRTALSVVAVVADRWARTAGRTWTAPRPAVDVDVVPMRPEHAAQVLAIHQAGLDTDNASFETCAPTWEEFDACRHPHHRFVACDRRTGAVLGWVALTAVSRRPVYRVSGSSGCASASPNIAVAGGTCSSSSATTSARRPSPSAP